MLRWYTALLAPLTLSLWTLEQGARPLVDATRSFRVATFNIHKGADRDDHYDLQRTISAIARIEADIVGLQEVMRHHVGSGCADQPAQIAEGLTRLTGRRWNYVFAEAYVTGRRTCAAHGRGLGIETEGIAVLAPAMVRAERVTLPYDRVALVARSQAFPNLPVVVTHLAASRRNEAQRAEQVHVLLPWARDREAAVVMGDLNARPDGQELWPLLEAFRDSWPEGIARGRATPLTGASTRPGMTARIDYVLFDSASGLSLDSVEIVSTSDTHGGEVSDHRPVLATFSVTASARTRATASSSIAR